MRLGVNALLGPGKEAHQTLWVWPGLYLLQQPRRHVNKMNYVGLNWLSEEGRVRVHLQYVYLLLYIILLTDLLIGLQVGVSTSREILESWLVHTAGPPGICAGVWLGVSLPAVPTHVGLERPGSGGLRPVWNSECSNLFPALVMVSPARPRTFLEQSMVLGRRCLEPAVSAQTGIGSVRWVSLAESIPNHPCRHYDTSTTTSFILVNMD